MNNCLKCDNQIDDHRYHLGYTECVECSDTEKYSAHQDYPPKTGGYGQPVSSTKKKHLERIDRRSSSGVRTAKGIMKDKSWDRWLKNIMRIRINQNQNERLCGKHQRLFISV